MTKASGKTLNNLEVINADEINAVDIYSNTLFAQEADVKSIFTVPMTAADPSTVVGSIDGEIMINAQLQFICMEFSSIENITIHQISKFTSSKSKYWTNVLYYSWKFTKYLEW